METFNCIEIKIYTTQANKKLIWNTKSKNQESWQKMEKAKWHIFNLSPGQYVNFTGTSRK